jgi:hypothetical protein
MVDVTVGVESSAALTDELKKIAATKTAPRLVNNKPSAIIALRRIKNLSEWLPINISAVLPSADEPWKRKLNNYLVIDCRRAVQLDLLVRLNPWIW